MLDSLVLLLTQGVAKLFQELKGWIHFDWYIQLYVAKALGISIMYDLLLVRYKWIRHISAQWKDMGGLTASFERLGSIPEDWYEELIRVHVKAYLLKKVSVLIRLLKVRCVYTRAAALECKVGKAEVHMDYRRDMHDCWHEVENRYLVRVEV